MISLEQVLRRSNNRTAVLSVASSPQHMLDGGRLVMLPAEPSSHPIDCADSPSRSCVMEVGRFLLLLGNLGVE